MKKRYCLTLLLAIAAVVPWPVPAGAASTVAFGRVSGSPCSQVAVPVQFTSDPATDISAVSSDIMYDSSLFTPVDCTLGEAGAAADKQAFANLVEPGHYRIAVLSLQNQDPIPSGVIATVTFTIDCSAPLGAYSLENNPVCSTPQGTSAVVTADNGLVDVIETGSAEPDTISIVYPRRAHRSRPRPVTNLLIVKSDDTAFARGSELSVTPEGDISVLASLAAGRHLLALISIDPGVQGTYTLVVSDGEHVTHISNGGLTISDGTNADIRERQIY